MIVSLYQPSIYYDDGINIGWELPLELCGDEYFESREECEDWLEENGYDLRDCVINDYDFDENELKKEVLNFYGLDNIVVIDEAKATKNIIISEKRSGNPPLDLFIDKVKPLVHTLTLTLNFINKAVNLRASVLKFLKQHGLIARYRRNVLSNHSDNCEHVARSAMSAMLKFLRRRANFICSPTIAIFCSNLRGSNVPFVVFVI